MIRLRSERYSGLQVTSGDISANISAGNVLILNEPTGLACVLVSDITALNSNNLLDGPVAFAFTQADLVEAQKDSSSFTKGAKVYLNPRQSICTSTSSGNAYVGRAAKKTLSSDSTVFVADWSAYKSGNV